jgi:ubiquitin C-terminal hydrolase
MTSNFDKSIINDRRSQLEGNRIGFVNHGNTCYINSTLQCLFTIEDFVKQFLLDTDWITSKKNLLYRFHKLIVAIYNYPDGVNDSLKKFLKAFYEKNMFNKGTQNDANEFFVFLMNYLGSKAIGNQNYFNIEFDMKVGLRETVTCQEHVTVSQSNPKETMSFLVINIPNGSVHQGIREYFAPSTLVCICESGRSNRDCNAFRCPRCERHVTSIKSTKLFSPPQILVVHLNIYNYDIIQKVRLNVYEDFLRMN